MSFFNVGPLEIMVIALLAFILFGPQKMLSLATSFRKAFAEFQKNVSDVASAAMDQHEADRFSEPDEERAEFVRESRSEQEQSRRPNEFQGEDER